MSKNVNNDVSNDRSLHWQVECSADKFGRITSLLQGRWLRRRGVHFHRRHLHYTSWKSENSRIENRYTTDWVTRPDGSRKNWNVMNIEPCNANRPTIIQAENNSVIWPYQTPCFLIGVTSIVTQHFSREKRRVTTQLTGQIPCILIGVTSVVTQHFSQEKCRVTTQLTGPNVMHSHRRYFHHNATLLPGINVAWRHN